MYINLNGLMWETERDSSRRISNYPKTKYGPATIDPAPLVWRTGCRSLMKSTTMNLRRLNYIPNFYQRSMIYLQIQNDKRRFWRRKLLYRRKQARPAKLPWFISNWTSRPAAGFIWKSFWRESVRSVTCISCSLFLCGLKYLDIPGPHHLPVLGHCQFRIK